MGAVTSSQWGKPPGWYYRVLGQLESELGADWRLIVLGCADGKFVLPAARRGVSVCAIDIDPVHLFGGRKANDYGSYDILGLEARLRLENLTSRVRIINADFVEAVGRTERGQLVLTSGSLQYSYNTARSPELLMETVLNYAAPGGYVLVEYMLPYEEKYRGRINCPGAAWWRTWVGARRDLHVLSHCTGRLRLDPAHVEMPFDHKHQWGRLFARVLK